VEQSNSFIESEMALVFEGILKCAQKLLDTADIVRDEIFQQLIYAKQRDVVYSGSGSSWISQVRRVPE
jgi:hypothetical protein